MGKILNYNIRISLDENILKETNFDGFMAYEMLKCFFGDVNSEQVGCVITKAPLASEILACQGLQPGTTRYDLEERALLTNLSADISLERRRELNVERL